MSRILRLFRTDDATETIIAQGLHEALADAGHEPMATSPEPTLLDVHTRHAENMLARLRHDEALLEHQIAERQERLRQTIIAIEAYSLAHGRLTG